MKRMAIFGVLLSGLILSACGSTSSSSLPPAPSYAAIQANLTTLMCRIEQPNDPPYFVWKVQGSARGPETTCDLQSPAVNADPPTAVITASCAYDTSKAAIGYTFGCTVLDPGSIETRYAIQLQTPLEGKWWYVASSAATTEPPEAIRSVSYWEDRY
jgi:hypothetical protein